MSAETSQRPKRPSARLLVTDPRGRLLLFRFTPEGRPPFWGMPGGALDPGESFEQAARRELREETGHDLDPGPCIAIKHAAFTTLDDIDVDAEEHYFAIRLTSAVLDTAGHTDEERRFMQSYRWWTPEELAAQEETVYPEGLFELWQAQRDTRPVT